MQVQVLGPAVRLMLGMPTFHGAKHLGLNLLSLLIPAPCQCTSWEVMGADSSGCVSGRCETWKEFPALITGIYSNRKKKHMKS